VAENAKCPGNSYLYAATNTTNQIAANLNVIEVFTIIKGDLIYLKNNYRLTTDLIYILILSMHP
jgi:hypothetical protein